MTAVRIIACLDVHAGRVVKGVRFSDLVDSGDPAELGLRYERAGADELVMLDISAGPEGRATALQTVRRVRAQLGIPLCVGGGIRDVRDVENLLAAGADKVSVNSAAWRRPALIQEIAREFGRQCCVVAVDAIAAVDNSYRVVIDSGKTVCDQTVPEWLCRAAELGAGEFLITSRDRDGTGQGYDLGLLRSAVPAAGSVPIIASGGVAVLRHIAEAVAVGARAALLAGALHRGELSIQEIKEYLRKQGEVVRV
ncbi:MAG: imidazole glycerol phosphate synthase cyclase subunit [Spirochaetes bacterium]|nr:imidazole glycerol phosphate synthase cyclase subunit [Spirochaetota bacterium]MBU0954793.1 imidazole glycerol phosphate synthase cyclase subunit [Spirochaetota bacterium]